MARVTLHKELFEYDSAVRNDFPLICGVDEAGRGPLAGDVYAAAVILEDDTLIEYLNDSKKISEKRRELLFDEIKAKAKAWCIATASVEEIDSLLNEGGVQAVTARVLDLLNAEDKRIYGNSRHDPDMDKLSTYSQGLKTLG